MHSRTLSQNFRVISLELVRLPQQHKVKVVRHIVLLSPGWARPLQISCFGCKASTGNIAMKCCGEKPLEF